MVNEIKSKCFVRVRFHIFCLCADVFSGVTATIAVVELDLNRCARFVVKIPTQKSRLKNPDSSSVGSGGVGIGQQAQLADCKVFRHSYLHRISHIAVSEVWE